MQLIYRLTELDSNCLVIILRKLLALIFAKVEAVERILQSEAVRYLELFPRDDSGRTHLVRLYFETTVSIVKQVGLLSVNSRQNTNDGPAKEATVRCRIAAVEKRILFLRMAVDVAVDPYMPLFDLSERLE